MGWFLEEEVQMGAGACSCWMHSHVDLHLLQTKEGKGSWQVVVGAWRYIIGEDGLNTVGNVV